MPNKQPVIGIIGGTVWGNRGAESMLVTTIGKLRQSHSGAQFKVFTYYPAQDRLLVNDPTIQFLSSKPAALVGRHFPSALLAWFFRMFGARPPGSLLSNPIRALMDCDILVDIGGISFVDGRELFLPFNILTIWPAMMLGVPVIKLAQALGPFKSLPNRLAARLFLSRCHHIFARGDITAGHLKNLGLSNWTRAADIAFLYQPEFSLSHENEDQASVMAEKLSGWKKSGRKIICLSPSSLVEEKSKSSGSEYSKRLLELLQSLDDGKRAFLFLPNSTRAGIPSGRNNDIPLLLAIREIAAQNLPAGTMERIAWVDFDLNTASLRRLLSFCDLLLTSRFHSMVSGLSLCIPTLVIGWSHKYVETLADFGLQQNAADFNDARVDFSPLALHLLENGESVSRELAASLEKVRGISRIQFDKLEKLLA